jgi:hypothetical protein
LVVEHLPPGWLSRNEQWTARPSKSVSPRFEPFEKFWSYAVLYDQFPSA